MRLGAVARREVVDDKEAERDVAEYRRQEGHGDLECTAAVDHDVTVRAQDLEILRDVGS